METKSFEELKANPVNPRQISDHDFSSLTNSMKDHGDLSGIVFNVASGQLVGGHQRIQVIRKLPGEKRVTITNRYEQPDPQGTVALGYVWIGNQPFAYREVNWPFDATDESGKQYSTKEAVANYVANRAQGTWDLELVAQVNYELSKLANADDLLLATGQTPLEVNDSLSTVSNKGEADPEKTPKEPTMILRVKCTDDAQMTDLYTELKERGLDVKM